MNALEPLRRLDNRYWVMRHGDSEANRRGLIVSDPARGVAGYGLSERGRRQVHMSAVAGRDGDAALDHRTLIFCSDFLRALQTAQIVAERLGAAPPVAETALRERFFGDYEGASAERYDDVWRADRHSAATAPANVEPAAAVVARATALVWRLEQRYRARTMTILLVAHGDVLQLLQTAFERRAPQRHRDLEPLRTAELRELTLAPR